MHYHFVFSIDLGDLYGDSDSDSSYEYESDFYGDQDSDEEDEPVIDISTDTSRTTSVAGKSALLTS